MITIEEMLVPPVGPDEIRNAYETLRRFCRECHDSCGCDLCKMQGLCQVNISPRFWPEYDALQYGENHSRMRSEVIK